MLTYSAALELQLNSAITQVEWASKLKTMLGDNLRLRCFRDTNVNATNPAASGVEFLNSGLAGGIKVAGYKITGFGSATNVTIQLAADLSTGKSVLRIEGNGHWVQGSVGLPASGADFCFTASPTGAANTGVTTAIGVAPPTAIPSGTGYFPPALDADAPAYIIVDNWTNPANVVEAGRIHFNRRIKNWVFEDTEYAANIGDIRVTQSTESVVYGDMEIGAMLLSTDPAVGTINGKVLHQVLVNYRPTETNWPGYPRQTGAMAGGYQAGVTNTFPGPHKVRIMTADNRLLGTLDMPRDGLPINSSELSEIPTKSKPQRLNMHCASMLVWESHSPKINSYAKKYVPGVPSQFLRPSLMKQPWAVNATYAPVRYSQADGANHWYALRKWSLPVDKAMVDADIAERSANDPYLFPQSNLGLSTPAWATANGLPSSEFGVNTGYGHELVMGWGYEPGSWCAHDMYSGPGGIRVDRACIPTPHVIHMTDPNWIHLRDNTPITEMVKHWNLGYFNHAIHNFIDVKKFSSVPVDEVLVGMWAHTEVYYNSFAVFTDLNHSIATKVFPNGVAMNDAWKHGGGTTDAKGRLVWNGYSVDWYHNYSAPGWAAILYNSPAHAVSAKFRHLASIMCQAVRADPAKSNGAFLVRDQAWSFLQHALMWKLGSEHPLGISQRQVEDRIEAELMSLYTNIYTPVFVNNDPSIWARGIRNFGFTLYKDNSYGWMAASFALHYYMAHTLQIWKQFGLWKRMCDRSPACKTVLLMIIKCLDKGCIDYYLDTDGCYAGGTYGSGVPFWTGDLKNGTEEAGTLVMATSWADWVVRVNPKVGAQDLVHNADGSLRGPDIGEWSRMQWPFIRRDYFSDIPADRDVNAACTKVLAWQKALDDNIAAAEAAGTAKRTIASWDQSVHPGVGRILPPTVLGE